MRPRAPLYKPETYLNPLDVFYTQSSATAPTSSNTPSPEAIIVSLMPPLPS